MTIIKLLGVSLLCCTAAALLRAYKPELVIPFVLAAGCALLLAGLDALSGIWTDLRAALAAYGVDLRSFNVAIRVVGIAYLIQFASNLCRDAGESALCGKVEMLGRIMILSVSVPVILDVLDILARFAAYI